MAHCLSVAGLAQRLAGRHEVSAEKAYLAGLVHDYAKELPKEKLLDIVGGHRQIDKVEETHPHILHGEAGSYLLPQALEIKDSEILEAVRCHTLAGPSIGKLAKIIYISDYLEPTRNYAEVLRLRRMLEAGSDLDKVYRACLQSKLLEVVHRGLPLPPQTVAAWNEGWLSHCI